MLNVKYGSRYGRSLLSVLRVHFVRISARFHKAYRYGPNRAVPPESMGGSVAVTARYVALVQGWANYGPRVTSGPLVFLIRPAEDWYSIRFDVNDCMYFILTCNDRHFNTRGRPFCVQKDVRLYTSQWRIHQLLT